MNFFTLPNSELFTLNEPSMMNNRSKGFLHFTTRQKTTKKPLGSFNNIYEILNPLFIDYK